MLDSTVISIDDYGKPHSLNQNKHVKKKEDARHLFCETNKVGYCHGWVSRGIQSHPPHPLPYTYTPMG